MLYPLAIYPFLRIFPKNGRNYTVHPIKSFVLPALLHMIRFALANNIWNRCMFFAIPRYTTFEYPICFFTMRNGCSTLQRTADFSCSIFLSQLKPLKSSAILRLDGRLFTRNSISDFFSSSLIAGWFTAPRYQESPYTTSSSSLMRFAVSVTSCILADVPVIV